MMYDTYQPVSYATSCHRFLFSLNFHICSPTFKKKVELNMEVETLNRP